MKTVGRDASLAEASVQQAERHQSERRRAKPRAPRTPHSSVSTVKVDPRVMAAVKRILTPQQRVEIVSATEVRVVNR